MTTRRCNEPCPHLTAEKTDRCTKSVGHDGSHVVVGADGKPERVWQLTSRERLR